MRDVDGNVDRMRVDLDHLPQVLAALDTTAAPVSQSVNLRGPADERIDLTAVELDSSGAPVPNGVNGVGDRVPVGAGSGSSGAHAGNGSYSGNGTRGAHGAHGTVGNGWPTGGDQSAHPDRTTGGPA